MKTIHLYTPYYNPETFERQQELDACMRRNCAATGIDRIFLLVDDGAKPPLQHPKLTVITIPSRPRYNDWLALSKEHSAGAISVLANSDIHFDESIGNLTALFRDQVPRFVALSRYDVLGQATTPHKNPHWSQDAWAFDPAIPLPATLEAQAAIPLGVPRCDNKIAYVFFIHGWTVSNPCRHINSYHLHETQIRSYDLNLDKRILGGVAYVHPAEDLTAPSNVDIDVWTLGNHSPGQLKVNRTIPTREAKGIRSSRKSLPSHIVAYDHEWQYPAITEQHAFNKMLERAEIGADFVDAVYFGFPWATLFDNLLHNQNDKAKCDFLEAKLNAFRGRFFGRRAVATVCQHIRMLKFQDRFAELGITDIFWSHAIRGQSHLPDHPSIRIHPFPLYPVQALGIGAPARGERRYLFSFVGARAAKNYLTESRNIILDLLAGEPDGFIAGNDSWHFQKIVYDHQVRRQSSAPNELVDHDAAERFKLVLSQSIFSLCPSGSGPNSIRLWESMGLGAIPVILADTLALPGDQDLWRRAAVFCGEDEDSIRALPEKLRAIAADETRLAEVRRGVEQLWELYGNRNFVHDVDELLRREVLNKPIVIPASLQRKDDRHSVLSPYRILLMATNDVLVHPAQFRKRFDRSPETIRRIFRQSNTKAQANFIRSLELRGFNELLPMIVEGGEGLPGS